MELIDSHAHVYGKEFAHDLPQVLERAKEAGLTTMVAVGADLELEPRGAGACRGAPAHLLLGRAFIRTTRHGSPRSATRRSGSWRCGAARSSPSGRSVSTSTATVRRAPCRRRCSAASSAWRATCRAADHPRPRRSRQGHLHPRGGGRQGSRRGFCTASRGTWRWRGSASTWGFMSPSPARSPTLPTRRLGRWCAG